MTWRTKILWWLAVIASTTAFFWLLGWALRGGVGGLIGA